MMISTATTILLVSAFVTLSSAACPYRPPDENIGCTDFPAIANTGSVDGLWYLQIESQGDFQNQICVTLDSHLYLGPASYATVNSLTINGSNFINTTYNLTVTQDPTVYGRYNEYDSNLPAQDNYVKWFQVTDTDVDSYKVLYICTGDPTQNRVMLLGRVPTISPAGLGAFISTCEQAGVSFNLVFSQYNAACNETAI